MDYPRIERPPATWDTTLVAWEQLGSRFGGSSVKTGWLGDVLHDDSFKVDVCSLKKSCVSM